MKRALITGIGGQDGSYLAELLLEQGDAVTGLVRPGAGTYANLDPVQDRIELVDLFSLKYTFLDDAPAEWTRRAPDRFSLAVRAGQGKDIDHGGAPT